jgi:quercetin dioxygenase-like cupin family protein
MANGSSQVVEETLHHRGTILVRRLLLTPGEATRWHRNPFHCVTVVLNGDALAIEFRDGSPKQQIRVIPGQVDWYEPSDRTHRAINIGDAAYEDITVFFLTQPPDIPQPDAP